MIFEARFTTRRVVQVAIVAALYAVFTVAIAPVSYGPVQFRASEALKAFVLFDPWLAIGIGIGTFFANLASPFVGPWELAWMPLTDIAGGLLAWFVYRLLGRWPAVSMVLYAATTSMAVSAMLWALGVGGFWFLAASVMASEIIILIGGLPIMLRMGRWLESRR